MGVTILGTRARVIAQEERPRTWRRLPVQTIQRRPQPYWQERGWTRVGDVFTGTYQTRYGSFVGRIEQRGPRSFRFYITDPPTALMNSAHWACFAPRGAKGYRVHMSTHAEDISAGILTIERLIASAHGA